MSLARNTFQYSLALVYQKVLGFIYFALLARSLGVEDTGQYVFALSFTTLFSVLADIGFAPVLIREIAKDKSRTQKLFSQVFSVKIFISLLTFGLVVLFVNWLGYPSLTKTLVYIAGAVMVLDSFSLIHWAVWRGHQNLKYEALGVMGFQTITVGLGLILLYSGFGVIWLLIATLAGSSFFFIFSLSLLLNKLKLKLQIIFDKASVKWFIITALPFALAGVFARIYTQIDTVMLSKIGCTEAAICEDRVGWYGVASKVTLALQFIPLALSAALFPALSEQYEQAREKLVRTYEQAWRYLALIVLPIAFGIITLAPELVVAIWGREFLPAAAPLQILMGSLVFLFLTFPNGALLNAAGKQLVNTTYMGVAVVINVILNIFLITQWQMTGAALASISSTFVLFALGFIKSYQLIKFRLRQVAIKFTKLIIAGLVMGLVLVMIKSQLHIIVTILLGGAIYAAVAFMLGELKREDFQLIKGLIPAKSDDNLAP